MERRLSTGSGAGPWLVAALASVGVCMLLACAVGISAALHGRSIHPGSAAALYVGLMMLWAGCEAGLSTGAGDGEGTASRNGWPALTLAGLNGLLLLVITTAPLLRSSPAAPSAFGLALGVVLCVTGGGLRCLALRRLGRRFNSDNTIGVSARLEVGGPYRWLAHPSEVGQLLVVSGGLCLIGQNGDWLWLFALYALMVPRIVLEERELLARYRGLYWSYRRRRFDPLPSSVFFGGEVQQ